MLYFPIHWFFFIILLLYKSEKVKKKKTTKKPQTNKSVHSNVLSIPPEKPTKNDNNFINSLAPFFLRCPTNKKLNIGGLTLFKRFHRILRTLILKCGKNFDFLKIRKRKIKVSYFQKLVIIKLSFWAEWADELIQLANNRTETKTVDVVTQDWLNFTPVILNNGTNIRYHLEL